MPFVYAGNTYDLTIFDNFPQTDIDLDPSVYAGVLPCTRTGARGAQVSDTLLVGDST